MTNKENPTAKAPLYLIGGLILIGLAFFAFPGWGSTTDTVSINGGTVQTDAFWIAYLIISGASLFFGLLFGFLGIRGLFKTGRG